MQITKKIKEKQFMIVLSFLITIAVAYADSKTGHEVSLSIFFLIPVSLAAIASNFRVGIAISVVSAIAWYWNDVSSGPAHSHWLIPVWNSVMRFGYFILHSFFLSRYVEQLAINREYANTDTLTGARNSRYLRIRLTKEMESASAGNLTLAYIDLDNFKQVNDQYSHAEGDIVLRSFVDLVTARIRETDFLARIGGDEFVLVMPGCDTESSRNAIEVIIANARKLFLEKGWPISLSIGAVTTRTRTISSEDLIASADHLMYDAKKQGKNLYLQREIH